MKQLSCLQVGRGLAAFSVLLFHSEVVNLDVHPDSAFASLFNLAFTGVDFFFLLSGFLMMWVHSGDFDRPSRLGNYFSKRFTRIYPIYWVLCLFLVPLTFLLPALRQNQPATGFSLLASFFLLPHPGSRILGVAWTLEYEILFYLAFSIFFLSARFGVAMFSLWFGATAEVAAWGPLPIIPTGAPDFIFGHAAWLFGFLLNLHLVEFFAGMLLAWAIQRGAGRIERPLWLVSSAIALGLGLQLFAFREGSHALHLEQGHRLVTLFSGIIASAIVFGAVKWETQRVQPVEMPEFLQLLGAASYSIYLTHFLVISFVRVVVHHSARVASIPAGVLMMAMIVAGILPGLLLHKFVERPLLTFSSRMTRRPPSVVST